MYNVCRIPGVSCDSVSQPDPASPAHNKVHLMIRDWSYAITVYNRDNELLEARDIEYRLWCAVEDAQKRAVSGAEEAVPVGVLSADERDIWAKVVLVFTVEYYLLLISVHINRIDNTCLASPRPTNMSCAQSKLVL